MHGHTGVDPRSLETVASLPNRNDVATNCTSTGTAGSRGGSSSASATTRRRRTWNPRIDTSENRFRGVAPHCPQLLQEMRDMEKEKKYMTSDAVAAQLYH